MTKWIKCHVIKPNHLTRSQIKVMSLFGIYFLQKSNYYISLTNEIIKKKKLD